MILQDKHFLFLKTCISSLSGQNSRLLKITIREFLSKVIDQYISMTKKPDPEPDYFFESRSGSQQKVAGSGTSLLKIEPHGI